MFAPWLVLLALIVTANADLTVEQFKLQYKIEEDEHLQQRLEVNLNSVLFVCFDDFLPKDHLMRLLLDY